MPCAEMCGGNFCSPHPACGHLLPKAEKEYRRWSLCQGQKPRPFHWKEVPVFLSERKFSYPLFLLGSLRWISARRPDCGAMLRPCPRLGKAGKPLGKPCKPLKNRVSSRCG